MHHHKPIFLLQNNYFEQLGRLIQPCLDFCSKNSIDFVDRSMIERFDPDALGVDWTDWAGVIVYGSVQWVKRCRESSLAPWAFYEPEAFASSTWVPYFGDDALNWDGIVITLNELEKRLHVGEQLHVRPDQDDKAFVGGVYDMRSWNGMLDRRITDRQSIPETNLPCFASSLKEISAEHRCWFVNGDLIDVSTYRKDRQPHVARCLDPGIMREAMRLSKTYLPLPSVVMDVAETETGCKIIEFNPICSSGWYAADVNSILSAWSAMLISTRKSE